MVFDSEKDKKLVMHVLHNYPMEGPYHKLAPAVQELSDLLRNVIAGTVKEVKNDKAK